MIVVISTEQLPKATPENPPTSGPAVTLAHAVQMPPDAAISTPRPTVWTVEVVLLEQLPIGFDSAPPTLAIVLQDAFAIPVQPNALERSPNPAGTAVGKVSKMVLAPQFPVSKWCWCPCYSGPVVQNSFAVKMKANSLELTPTELWTAIIMVFLPQLPIRANSLPLTLIVAIQGFQTVRMEGNAPVTTPNPFSPPMQLVVEVVAPHTKPIFTNNMPSSTIPTLQDSHAVQMAINTALLAPEPPRGTVEVVTLPKVPIRPNSAPFPLDISPQGSVPIPVYTNAPVGPPAPPRLGMQHVVVVIAPHTVPVTTNNHPLCSSPTLLNAMAIAVTADPAKSTPEPAVWFVVVVLAPTSPHFTRDLPVSLNISPIYSVTVEVDSNSPVGAPSAASAAMQAMIVVVTPV